MLCSIIISVYNKEDHVAAAVDSALAQSYKNIEVIAIDDGSTDRSVSILQSYGNRVALVRKTNGGQASAINHGYNLSRGDVIIFLDGDDVLLPDIVDRIMRSWTPLLSKVHFRLQKIRANGTELKGKFLPPYRPPPDGDLKPLFREFALYPTPPMSGNAFARQFLARVMPIPEGRAACADTLLIGLAAWYGQIGALASPGGCWRQTETNHSRGGLEKLEEILRSNDEYIDFVRGRLSADIPNSFGARWPQHLKQRLIVEKFHRARLYRHLTAYLNAILTWPEYSFLNRAKFVLWAFVVFLFPAVVLRAIPGIAGQNVRLSVQE